MSVLKSMKYDTLFRDQKIIDERKRVGTLGFEPRQTGIAYR